MTILGTIKTPIGLLSIKVVQGKLTELDILPASSRQSARLLTDPLAKQAGHQLTQYFSCADFSFNLPLKVQGTDFQKRVWNIMRKIPSGSVMTYGEVASELDSSPRAVGNACRANPLPIIIPCHRVVSQSGIGGYGGHTDGAVLAIKDWLLHHEGVVLN